MAAEGKLILTAEGPKRPRAAHSSVGDTAILEPTSIAQLTRPSLVMAGIRNRDGMEVLRTLSDALAGEGLVTNASQFFSTAMNREITCNTAVPPEWAIPHVRSAHCTRLCLAVATCPQGVNWFGTGGVRAIFLFGVQEREAVTYMFAVSALARLNMVEGSDRVARIGQAQDSETLLDLLERIPLRPPAPKSSPVPN